MGIDIFKQTMLTEEEKEYLREEIKKADVEIKRLLRNNCFTKEVATGQEEKCKSEKQKGMNGNKNSPFQKKWVVV